MRRPAGEREQIIGPDSGPESPYPRRMGGIVMKGFGRGSKELGIPTANLPVDNSTTPWITSAPSGVYFGWSSLLLPSSHPSLTPSTSSSPLPSTTFPTSVPYPKAGVEVPKEKSEEGWRVYPMVMSIGFNPFYKNETRSAEVHVMHGFERDFYGCEMRIGIVGFIREEFDYESLEALVEDIKTDIEVTSRSLARPAWAGEKAGVDEYLWGGEGPKVLPAASL